jgi:uncharacterized membrane protein YidH (DUF202 family)
MPSHIPDEPGYSSAAGPAADSDDLEERDPGLAAERTSLAWTRTAISFAALGGVVLKVSVATGVVILLLAPAVWRLGRLRGPAPGRLWLITVAVVLVALLSLSVALISHGASRALRPLGTAARLIGFFRGRAGRGHRVVAEDHATATVAPCDVAP